MTKLNEIRMWRTFLPYIAIAILIVASTIFCLKVWSMQPYLFSEASFVENEDPEKYMTPAEYKHWRSVYNTTDAICWVLSFACFYLATFFIPYAYFKYVRMLFSVIYWTALMNLLDEQFWNNTILYRDEYVFFIIIAIHAAIYGIHTHVKGKGIGTNGMGRR